MKRFSAGGLVRKIGEAASRFPLAFAFIVTATLATMPLVWWLSDDYPSIIAKIAIFCLPGVFLAFSAVVFAESRGLSGRAKMASQAVALLMVCLWFLLTPADLSDFGNPGIITFISLSLASVLSISFASSLSCRFTGGFWQFNNRIISGLALAVIFTGVLFAGIELAFAAMRYLLDITISSRLDVNVFVLLSCFAAPVIFLSMVPADYEALNREAPYPKWFRTLNYFILIPLVVLYLIILYVYGARILFSWELPEGGVAYLVLTLAALGILPYLFIRPLMELPEQRLAVIYSRWFFPLTTPLIVLLLTGVYRRISEYGVTPNRYILLALTLWLAAAAIYFTVSRKRDIRLIPISLALLALFSSAGPWGIAEVSVRSQLGQLEKILKENEIIVDGKLTNKQIKPEEVVYERIIDIMRSLENLDAEKRLVKLINAPEINDFMSVYEMAYAMKISESDYSNISNPGTFSQRVDKYRNISVSGYDLFIPNATLYDSSDTLSIDAPSGIYKISLSSDKDKIFAKKDGIVVGEFDFATYYAEMKKLGRINADAEQDEVAKLEEVDIDGEPDNGIDFTLAIPDITVRFCVNAIEGRELADNGVEITYLDANLLVRLKNKR